MNVDSDPCFEDKSSSLTFKYRPVHFFESSCMFNFWKCNFPMNHNVRLSVCRSVQIFNIVLFFFFLLTPPQLKHLPDLNREFLCMYIYVGFVDYVFFHAHTILALSCTAIKKRACFCGFPIRHMDFQSISSFCLDHFCTTL